MRHEEAMRAKGDGLAGVARAARPARMPGRRWLWLVMLCLGLACWAAMALFGTVRIDAQGLVHEPSLGLVSLGLVLCIMAGALAVYDIVRSLRQRH